MKTRDRLIVALDRSSRGEILDLADSLHGLVGMYKVGLQAFVANGPGIVQDLVSRGERVFLDLKLHDIPNTAAHAVAEAAHLGVSMLTVHIVGGAPMMEAARQAIPPDSGMLVVGVTVLTSLGDDDLLQIGMRDGATDSVQRLAALARGCGLHGVVASPREIELIRETCGDDFLIVTPGIRGRADRAGDQKRTMTARQATRAGASFIVVGRPITQARNPRSAALRILASMSAR